MNKKEMIEELEQLDELVKEEFSKIPKDSLIQVLVIRTSLLTLSRYMQKILKEM